MNGAVQGWEQSRLVGAVQGLEQSKAWSTVKAASSQGLKRSQGLGAVKAWGSQGRRWHSPGGRGLRTSLVAVGS